MCLYILPNSELTSLLSLGCLRCWPVVMDMSFAWWLLCQRVELRQDSLDWQRNEESATETYINTYSVEQDGPRTFVYIFLVCINVFFSGPNECRNWYVWPTGKIFKSDGIPHNKIRKTLNNISYKCGHKALSFKIDTFSNFYAIYNTLFNIVIYKKKNPLKMVNSIWNQQILDNVY